MLPVQKKLQELSHAKLSRWGKDNFWGARERACFVGRLASQSCAVVYIF